VYHWTGETLWKRLCRAVSTWYFQGIKIFVTYHVILQGCGAGTQISGSSSWHLKFLTPASELFGTLKTKNHCIICTVGLLRKLCLLNEKSNFMLRLHHSNFFGSRSSHPRSLRLHSSAVARQPRTLRSGGGGPTIRRGPTIYIVLVS